MKIWNMVIKLLGYLVLFSTVFCLALYYFLFVDKEKYYPVKSPVVQEKLDQWQDVKFGLFMHWGPYSQWGVVESWSICSEDEPWCARKFDHYCEYKAEYESLKETFDPVNFNPAQWAAAAKYAGMKYVVFTTKHHDGFCMFDTKTTDYKITDAGCPFSTNARANITKELFDAFRSEDFMIGAYFSKPDWHSEYYWWPYFATPDRNVNYEIEKYPERWEAFVHYTHEQIDELMTNYGRIDLLWLDGGWVRPLSRLESRVSDFISNLYYTAGYTQFRPPQNQDVQMDQLVEKARARQPGLIVVDRAVEGPNQNYLTPENQVPEAFMEEPWESCITMHGGWSFSPNAQYRSSRNLIHLLIDVVSKGGNLLLNIGPGPSGRWHQEAYERLGDVGDWMHVNQSAIYNTHGRPHFSENHWRFTYMDRGAVNACYLLEEHQEVPKSLTIQTIKPARNASIKLLGYDGELEWEQKGGKLSIQVPAAWMDDPPNRYAWVLQISAIE